MNSDTGCYRPDVTNGPTRDSTDCNCRVKQSCPVNGRCINESIVYRAEVRQAGNDTVKTYTRLTEGTYKQRYNNNLSTFRHQKYENSTGLSKYIWQKKRDNEKCDVKWLIVQRAKQYSNVSKRCDLCTTEKLKISDEDKSVSLKKKIRAWEQVSPREGAYPSKLHPFNNLNDIKKTVSSHRVS